MPRLSLLTLILILLNVGGAIARTDLSVTRPTTDFTTNNQILQIEGVVSSSAADVLVSTDTPPGVAVSIHPPDEFAHSLYSVVVDVRTPQPLKTVLIRPTIDGEFLFGPRRIRVAFSRDGATFQDFQHLNVSSHLNPAFHRIVVDLPTPVTARFIQVDMLEGWQRERISVESIEFLDVENQRVQASVEDISLLLNLARGNSAPFLIEVLLKAGRNPISLFARPLSPTLAELPENRARESISPVYLPELRPDEADDGRFILSDGNQARIVMPASVFEGDIKRLQFGAIPPTDVPPLSYLRNTRIAKGTTPVVVYRFEALKQGQFAAEATSALSNQPPTLAVDGILEPPSTWMASLAPLPIHITVDFGERRTIGRIDVHANVVEGQSFGPQRAKIRISNDNSNFTEILDFLDFQDESTAIELPTRPTTRYVRLEITESKPRLERTERVINIQLNEIEFFDASGSKIVPFVTLDHLVFEQPALLELRYTTSELRAANISQEANLRIFAWDGVAQEWQLAGGRIDSDQQTVSLALNYIAQFALFQAVIEPEIQAVWSFNPFSPNGNGIADTTRLTIVNPDGSQADSVEFVVEIFDLHSKRIRTLINRTVIRSNSISVEWDGRDRTGQIVNIGPYIYQIRLGSQIQNGVIVVGK
jgi:hypothetical protein